MSKKPEKTFDLNSFSERLSSESDRACRVLGAALLDWKLEQLFHRKFVKFEKDLLEQGCPLSSFSVRIKLGRAINWISEDVCSDLDAIRNIRNEFAHSFDHELSFSTQSITSRCQNLKTAQAFIDGFDVAAARPNNNASPAVYHFMQSAFLSSRRRFQVAVEPLAQHLDDIGGKVPEFGGADIIAEARALTAGTRLVITATDIAGPSADSFSKSGQSGEG